MWEWVGMLFGICIRTGVRLGLNLPSFVWKPLAGEDLITKDLRDIDCHTCEILDIIKKCDEKSYEEAIREKYTTTRSDRSTVELIPDGSRVDVKYKDREKYINLVYETRYKEHELQIQTIRKGISKIIPVQLLNL
eukprot:UN25667